MLCFLCKVAMIRFGPGCVDELRASHTLGELACVWYVNNSVVGSSRAYYSRRVGASCYTPTFPASSAGWQQIVLQDTRRAYELSPKLPFYVYTSAVLQLGGGAAQQGQSPLPGHPFTPSSRHAHRGLPMYLLFENILYQGSIAMRDKARTGTRESLIACS